MQRRDFLATSGLAAGIVLAPPFGLGAITLIPDAAACHTGQARAAST